MKRAPTETKIAEISDTRGRVQDSVLVNKRYIIVPDSILSDDYDKGLRHFKITYKPRFGYEQILSLFKRVNETYIFPKASGPMLYTNKIVKPGYLESAIDINHSQMTKVSKASWRGLMDINRLDKNQRVIINYLLENYFNPGMLLSGIAGCVLVAPPGIGKTRIAVATALLLGHKILYVTSNNLLMNQAADEIKVLVGDKLRITFVGGSQSDNSGDIVIGIINSVIKQPPTFFADFGFTIMDEAHSYCSTVFVSIFWLAQSFYTLALTASPDERLDGYDKCLATFIGPIIDVESIAGFEADVQAFDCEVRSIMYKGPADHTKTIITESTGMINNGEMLNQLSRDPHRNHMLINIIINNAMKGRNILVFGEQREFLQKIMKYLVDKLTGRVDVSNFIMMIGGISDSELERVFSTNKESPIPPPVASIGASAGTAKAPALPKMGRILFTTYAYSRQGLSIKCLDTILFMTPRKNNMRQICGRIFRKGGDPNIKRIIYDIVDSGVSLKSQYASRKKYYVSKKYEMIAAESYTFTQFPGVAI